MGVEPLTPAAVGRLLAAEEIGGRCSLYGEERAARIGRYGAMVGSRIERFARQGRCMDYARDLIRRFEAENRSFPSGLVLLADQLESGQGRFQRVWHAPSGGLWLTLVLVNTLLPEHGRLYPLAAGVACCETVRHYGINAHLKWVNDLHLEGRKMAGVLVETVRGERFGEEYVLIGIGLNVNNDRFPPELADLATSMKEAAAASLALEEVAARLLSKLAWNIGLLHEAEAEQLAGGRDSDDPAAPLHPMLTAWLNLSDTIGRKVLFGFDVQQNPQYQATVEGLDPTGGLILRHLSDHALITEYAGEIRYLD